MINQSLKQLNSYFNNFYSLFEKIEKQFPSLSEKNFLIFESYFMIGNHIEFFPNPKITISVKLSEILKTDYDILYMLDLPVNEYTDEQLFIILSKTFKQNNLEIVLEYSENIGIAIENELIIDESSKKLIEKNDKILNEITKFIIEENLEFDPKFSKKLTNQYTIYSVFK